MLRAERTQNIEVWTLDRPETKNALSFDMLRGLDHALQRARADQSLRAVVITGGGNVFASGGDLRELRTRLSPADAEILADAGRRLCEGFEQLPIPIIAALNGPAIGGGAELAVACDLRVADASARLCFKHGRMGVTTAWGTFPKLLALVGPSHAAYMLFTGHEVSAQTAFAYGLVDSYVDEGTAEVTAVAWALDISQSAPLAVSEFKQMLKDAAFSFAEQRARERERFIRTWASEDHREAIEAYFERRKPVWSGR